MQELFIAIFIGVAGYFGSKLVDILQNIQKSIETLNIQIAVVIERTDSHEKRIEKLEEKTNA